MSGDWTGAIDCDFHPRAPSPRVLSRYMDEHWRSTVETRGIDVWESIAYPANSPLTMRPDWREARANADPVRAAQATLDRFGFAHAICNCLFPVQAFRDENLAAAFARAVNDWLAAEWLARDPRLRGSVVLPMQSPARAAEEIERRADDPRFVQILLLAMGEVPLGRRQFWPVYAAAVRHGLPIGIHAGSAYRHPVTSLGWPSYYAEDYAAQAQGFQSQVASLISEGVFAKFPDLKVVLIESGVTWLPGFLWRFAKFWRGLRTEVPWVDRSPAEIVRDHFRLTIQPLDAPPSPAAVERAIDHLRSDDMLLYASDFPHWQFDGDDAMPPGIPAGLQ
ncbi:MAG TPA: amidohydrolase family protein, partial [Hyphomicrobiaceae bacterium]